MNNLKKDERTAFSVWMRTGRWPRSVEVKFNPWHDPRNGQFTSAGMGTYSGPGSSGSAIRGSQSTSRTKPSQEIPPYQEDPSLQGISTMEEVEAWKTQELAKHPNTPAHRKRIEEQYQRYKAELAKQKPRNTLDQIGDFAAGFGEGVYNVGKGTVTGLHSLVTTNPVTTVRALEHGIAGAVDAALAAEDTPAYVQIDRAANKIANASAHDWGYGLGTIGGNAALAVAPGAIAAKVSAATRAGELEAAMIPKGPPKITWVDESPTFRGPSKELAKAYNDSARGALSNIVIKKGQAPALERTMADGTKRYVKFDGVDYDSVYGHVMIDRKWSLTGRAKTINQAIRQS
ncbi:hypothetical protein [Sphingomonas sp. KR3-1]|uniref:hypothetical protein n=1 Tax=Sphingomonas sp. KR3-1 TaxID=3156611 RepID=UPI0032B311B8